jgi:alanine dehydrogenase
VDSRAAAQAEAGDLIQTMWEGYLKPEDLAEIGEVLTGHAEGRRSPEEITFFKSVGIAVQDAATAQAVLHKAEKMNLGSVIEI